MGALEESWHQRFGARIRWALGRRAPAGALSQRWVVVDLETSGLDARRDEVLAIGAVAVVGTRIAIADSFEMGVRVSRASSVENILVHEIGAEAQLRGTEPAEALTRFRDYVGSSPLVAFHAEFDRAFLARATRKHRCAPLRVPWLDVAELAPALNTDFRGDSLDDWLAHFAIPNGRRHHAASDALATAMLFVRLLAQLPPESADAGEAYRLATHRRHLGR